MEPASASNVASLLERSARMWPRLPAVAEGARVLHDYAELARRAAGLAAALRGSGLAAGDRVALVARNAPAYVETLFACWRAGLVAVPVNAKLHPRELAFVLADSGARIVFADRSWCDALSGADATGAPGLRVIELGGDLHARMCEGDSTGPVAAVSPAAPAWLFYTSGTTGRPKGCQHSTGGYLAYVAGTSRYYQDIHPEDTYWCAADIGWITGHSYIVYGPLALGTTSVMYEGVPTYPDPGRLWRIAERLGVTIFHTAPTTIRLLRKVGPGEPARYRYHFKHMTTVGEPIEPDVWRWYHDVVGKGEAVVVDTWWQTENGGFLGATLPALQPMKPGSCGPGALGIYPVILDEHGEKIEAGSGRAGNMCIRNPWPGSFQTIWGQPDRYVDIYYSKYCRDPGSADWRDWPYFSNDGAVQAADGYFRILGRVDDVINVAGHRLGTKELESAALMVDPVAEAAAVPVIDDLRGRAVEMYVSVKPGISPGTEVEDKVSAVIETEIGKIARPKNVWIVPDMPKTRSGKIMRRVIAGVSNFTDVGDITTLANPEVVDQIREQVQSAKKARGEVPRELSAAEAEEIEKIGDAR
jgi:acetyl-CoA synthetase